MPAQSPLADPLAKAPGEKGLEGGQRLRAVEEGGDGGSVEVGPERDDPLAPEVKPVLDVGNHVIERDVAFPLAQEVAAEIEAYEASPVADLQELPVGEVPRVRADGAGV